MLKLTKISFMAILAVVFLASCGGSDADVRDAARQQIAANPTPVTPTATPAAPQPAAPAGPTTSLSFNETTFDFGTIQQGEKVSHTYQFKNSGNEPLIISDCKGSCGCTVPQCPKEAIPVGGSGEITVEFDSKGKSGARNQRVTITANTDPAQTIIYLKGNVDVPAAPATK